MLAAVHRGEWILARQTGLLECSSGRCQRKAKCSFLVVWELPRLVVARRLCCTAAWYRLAVAVSSRSSVRAGEPSGTARFCFLHSIRQQSLCAVGSEAPLQEIEAQELTSSSRDLERQSRHGPGRSFLIFSSQSIRNVSFLETQKQNMETLN